jgi:hypothetical protein
MSESGEGRNRTGDTTVFSRVLYRLSYLARAASVAQASIWFGSPPSVGSRWAEAGLPGREPKLQQARGLQ